MSSFLRMVNILSGVKKNLISLPAHIKQNALLNSNNLATTYFINKAG